MKTCLLTVVKSYHVENVYDRAVLTNAHTGHVPGAPDFFFLLSWPRLVLFNPVQLAPAPSGIANF